MDQIKQAESLLRAGRLQEARKICQSFCKTESSSPQAWCLLSVINGALRLYSDAAQCAQRAIDIAPNYVMAHFNLALSQFNLNNIFAAIQGFQELLNIQPANWQACFYLGMCYEKLAGQDDTVITYYEQALNHIDPPPRDLVVRLINAYERVGSVRKSHLLVDDYLSKHPNDPAVGVIKARNETNDGHLEEARIYLENILNSDDVGKKERARALNQYGLLLDKLGEYKSAYLAFRDCQNIEAEINPQYSGDVIFEKIKNNREATSPDDISSWVQYPYNDELSAPIFIVGFPRSGTTLLERVISAHPDVIPSSEENIIPSVIDRLNEITPPGKNYPFNLKDLTESQVALLRKEYWDQVVGRCGVIHKGKLFIDKLPLNIIELCFINRIFPEALILVAIRDPRDVCLSCFMQHFGANHAMANFYNLDNSARFYNATMGLFEHYEKALTLNIYTIKYEDVILDIEQQARNLLSFLQLDWNDQVLSFYKNRKYKISTPSYHDTCKPIFSSAIGRWIKYEEFMNPVMTYLEPYIEKYGYSTSQDV
jgi:tetratricopeptide (TPR) repeat protein